MDVAIQSLVIEGYNDIDTSRDQSEPREPGGGLQAIRLNIQIDADTDEETLTEWGNGSRSGVRSR